jgi:hypothetical protein
LLVKDVTGLSDFAPTRSLAKVGIMIVAILRRPVRSMIRD